MHYTAEFVPAFNLHGATFPASGTELGDGAQEGSGEDVASGDESSESSDSSIPEGVTIGARRSKDEPPPSLTAAGSIKEKAHRRHGSVDSSYSVKTAASTKTADTLPPVPEQTGIEMSREELLQSRMPILIR